MSWERLPPASLAGARSTAASPTNKRNVGVLELKLKQRLQDDPNAVAVGVLHRHGRHQQHSHHDNHHHGSDPQQQLATRHPKRAHKLPQLDALASSNARPDSFEAARQSVMDALALSSPTRSVVRAAVQQTKAHVQHELAALPPVAGVFKRRNAPPTRFPRAYARNELPIAIESRAGGNTLRWLQPIERVEFAMLLPLCLEGLTEPTMPYSFLAREAAFALLRFGQSQAPMRVVECLHRVVPALRHVLETHEPTYVRDALAALELLTTTPNVGPLLVPYYRQLLPVLNLFTTKRRNLGDAMDFRQRRVPDVSAMVTATLETLERTGGPDAFVNIKYMVPTYEGVGPT